VLNITGLKNSFDRFSLVLAHELFQALEKRTNLLNWLKNLDCIARNFIVYEKKNVLVNQIVVVLSCF
jgi:hypothetical protein